METSHNSGKKEKEPSLPVLKGRYAPLTVIVAVIFVIVALSFILTNRCRENCDFVFNPELEAYVNELQTGVTKSKGGNNGEVEMTVSGRLDSVSSTEKVYTLSFEHFFENRQVKDKKFQYSFPIDRGSCTDACKDTIEALANRTEETRYNELTQIVIRYSLDNLSPFEKVKLFVSTLVSSLSDKRVYVEGIGNTDVNVSTRTYSEIEEACAQSINGENLLVTGKKLYSSLLSIVMNEELRDGSASHVSENTSERLMTVGWYDCYTCKDYCESRNEFGVGLNYFYFPLYAALLQEQGVEIDDAPMLELLSYSYGAKSNRSFYGFATSTDGVFNKVNPSQLWGTEPVCAPLYIARSTGYPEGTFIDVAEKICFDRAESYFSDGENLSGVKRVSEQDFSLLANRVVDDLTGFEASTYAQENSMQPGLLNKAIDDLIYGYYANDERVVEMGNAALLDGIWDFVKNYEFNGGELQFMNRKNFRDISLALSLKASLSSDQVLSGTMSDLIRKIEDISGAENYVYTSFDIVGSRSLASFDLREEYSATLDDLLLFYSANPEFYSERIPYTWKEAQNDWFTQHYLSEACGKSNSGYFVKYSTDGECIRESVGISSDIASMMYVLILTEE